MKRRIFLKNSLIGITGLPLVSANGFNFLKENSEEYFFKLLNSFVCPGHNFSLIDNKSYHYILIQFNINIPNVDILAHSVSIKIYL